jgi:beta-galactosidase
VGTVLNPAGMDWLIARACNEAQASAALDAPHGVEVVVRAGNGCEYIFVLNHTADTVSARLPRSMRDLLTGQTHAKALALEPYGVAILASS